jgi:uncharacterized membrane protein YeaQ/YmgE (transglycosylase-associated protein family)
MSDDEIIALMISGVITLFGWIIWYRMAMIRSFQEPPTLKFLLWLWPLIMLGVLIFILKGYAADDVRDSEIYLFMYVIMGAAWTVVGMKIMTTLGVSARDDVAERNNSAAIPAVIGAMTGLMLSFAGGNIGNGPSWMVVVFSSGIATLSLILAWIFINIIVPVAEKITVERDIGCGWRIGFILACIGAIAARGAVGDWVSCKATVDDFWGIFWPVVPALLGISFIERFVFAKIDDRAASVMLKGIIPSIIYVWITVWYLFHIGWYK